MFNRYIRNEDGMYIRTIVEEADHFAGPAVECGCHIAEPEPCSPQAMPCKPEHCGGLRAMLGRFLPANIELEDLLLLVMLVLILLDSGEDELVILIAIAMFLFF